MVAPSAPRSQVARAGVSLAHSHAPAAKTVAMASERASSGPRTIQKKISNTASVHSFLEVIRSGFCLSSKCFTNSQSMV